ncbi:transglutaminaseTgpA domain-containing protein [Plantactinospora siamensis]|uniref:TransglutaminaseTgpA domain-containing protein n=1 Tax=Plantactinospora siamensis TaxID=555372 RepID=A0ABV6NZL4_9ACTN
MRSTRYLGFVAAAATVLAAAPLSTIFDQWTWLIQVILAVAAGYGAATLARHLRAPLWGQVGAMLLALLLVLTWMFPSGREWLAVIPTLGTFDYFGHLIVSSGADMRGYGIPVPDTTPLLFITVLGVAGVAVVVDVLSVGLRRPALAGLPMLAIYSVPVAVSPDSVPALPFVVGTIGFLWLLVADNVDRVRRFGRRFTGDGRTVDLWEPSPLSAAGRRLATVGVVLAVLLPLAVPGMTTGLLSSIQTDPTGEGNGSGNGGPAGRVNLFAALSGQLNQSESREMARVTTSEQRPFYLRFAVADEVRTDGFRVRSPRGNPVGRGLAQVDQDSTAGVTRQTEEATVEISSDFPMPPLLPTYTDPTRVSGLDSSWLYDPGLQVIYSNRSQARGKKYTFQYVRSTYSRGVLTGAPSLASDDQMRRFTTVPREERVDSLVRRLTAGKGSDYAKVRALYDYFSAENGFRYTLSTKGGTSGSDIVDFLTNKQGFCQQYAAALAWMVRSAGVPARVAFGFTNGTSTGGNSYVLTNKNLHAWTEVYFTGIGWVPFDATPAASVPGSVRSAWAPDTDTPDAPAPSAGTDSADRPGAATGPGSNRPDTDPADALPGAVPETQAAQPGQPWWILPAVALLVLLIALPAVRRLMLRRRRTHRLATGPVVPAPRVEEPGVIQVVTDGGSGRARADAHAVWDELLDTMVDFRVPVNPAETPRLTAERLASDDLSGPAADAARLLGRAEELARYAPDPSREGPLGPALRSVRRGLAAGASRRTRMTAVLLPPSVLLRWRTATIEGYARMVNSADRANAGLRRWSPRRLIGQRVAR